MRIFCRFSALLGQQLWIWKLFSTWSRRGFLAAISSPDSISVPLDPEAISLIYLNCISQRVFLVADSIESEDCKKAIKNLESQDKSVEFEYAEDIKDADILITDRLSDIFAKNTEKYFIGNVFSSFLFYTLASQKKGVKNKWFMGLISIPFSFMVVLLVLFTLFYFLYGDYSNINAYFCKYHMFASMLFCSLAKLLRELLESDNEMCEYMKDNQLFCSSTFVFSRSSMVIGLVYLIFGTIVGIHYLIHHTLPFLTGLSMGILYFYTYLFKTRFKVIFFTLFGLGITYLTQSNFVNSFMGHVFL